MIGSIWRTKTFAVGLLVQVNAGLMAWFEIVEPPLASLIWLGGVALWTLRHAIAKAAR